MGKWYADTQFRRPDQETIKTQRGRIRQLMVENDAYTRKYLDEKKKYDHLLARVNSTSTLGSISLHNATTDPTVYHTLSPGGGIVVEPEASSASIDRANHSPLPFVARLQTHRQCRMGTVSSVMMMGGHLSAHPLTP
jgi:hypothetical protein